MVALPPAYTDWLQSLNWQKQDGSKSKTKSIIILYVTATTCILCCVCVHTEYIPGIIINILLNRICMCHLLLQACRVLGCQQETCTSDYMNCGLAVRMHVYHATQQTNQTCICTMHWLMTTYNMYNTYIVFWFVLGAKHDANTLQHDEIAPPYTMNFIMQPLAHTHAATEGGGYWWRVHT